MHRWFWALCLLLAAAAGVGAQVELELIPDAWPLRPRSTGYEYNQKSHHAPPEFISGGQSEAFDIPLPRGRRYRLVGVRVHNRGDEAVELVLRSPQIKRDKRLPLTVPPREFLTRYYPIREPKDLRLQVRLLPKRGREPVASAEAVLPEPGHVAAWPAVVYAIAHELRHEDAERRRLRARRVRVRVVDDAGEGVPGAQLLFLPTQDLTVVEGRSDAQGAWAGALPPGPCQVYAFGEVPERETPDDVTRIRRLPRYLVLRGLLEPAAGELELAPARRVEVGLRDAEEAPLSVDRLWVTPEPLVQAYRYAAVARRVGARARLDSRRQVPRGRLALLTSPGLGLQVATLHRETGLRVLVRGAVAPEGSELELRFDPERLARAVLDPATGVGPGRSARLRLESAAGREAIALETEALATCYLQPGEYRVELSYRLFGGQRSELAPYLLQATPGQLVDLTPRAPLALTLYHERADKKLQFWLAVRDAQERLFARLPRQPGGEFITVDAQGRRGRRPLNRLRWELEARSDTNVAKSSYQAEVPFGEERIVAAVRPSLPSVYNVQGASAQAPGCLEDRVQALLPQVKLALDGCQRFLNLPVGLDRIHMDFQIFLPPGVGGLGGGGTIQLDAQDLLRFAAGSDPLPGAFRHELGHNLGFGHDPYMLLAPAGVDEERFGTFGYRLLHAADFQRQLEYLQSPRHTETTPWGPGAGVYPGLRALFGPEVHLKMIESRNAWEPLLVAHELSSIERIATLYSHALSHNVAWVFRAHGWPVFDQRVELGLLAIRGGLKTPPRLNYARLRGAAISSWWVLGPVSESNPGDAWREVQWPSRFIRVDEDWPPASERQRFLYYRKVVAPASMEAKVLCAADVQLEIRVNGTAIGQTDASPQFSQPVHDEMMLDQTRAFSAIFQQGENVLTVAVNQLPGCKGFFLELVDREGKPLPLALSKDGPLDEPGPKRAKLTPRNPIDNGSFELGGNPALGWLRGAVEGKLGFRLVGEKPAQGDWALRAEIGGPTRGGISQRVVVEPETTYRLSAALRTQGLRGGEAFVSLFTGDLNDGVLAKTTPVRAANSPWKRYEATFFSVTRRAVYVACYVKGNAGAVEFDALELKVAK